jgi:cell division septation protein DedD
MMTILNLETRALPEVESRDVESRDLGSRDFKSRETAEQDPAPQTLSATTDYEIVLGRPQIASWLFVGVIAVAVCSSLAYLAGERIAAVNTAPISMPAPPPPPPAPALPTVSESAELPEVSILAAPDVKPAASLFAEPETGKVYIQIGAVERGMAMLLAEGLRGHGFDSFLAPGPNDKLFRVLIGPLPDPAAFRQAMVTVNAMDLASFARKYQK